MSVGRSRFIRCCYLIILELCCANASTFPVGLSQRHSFDACRHQRSLASVMFSLNVLSGPRRVLELNLVLRDKIHEFRGWVDCRAVDELAGISINLFGV